MSAIEVSNDPTFDPDVFADKLGERIALTSGKRWTIVEQSLDPKDLQDASRQTTFLDWHVDGSYHHPPPRYVLLHCIDPGHSNGSTQFADGHVIFSKLPRDVILVLSKLQMNYVGRSGVHAHEPILSLAWITICARGYVEPISKELSEVPSLRETARATSMLFDAMDDSICLDHHWKKYDNIIFDQRRIIHRRMTSAEDRQRKLYRMWWN